MNVWALCGADWRRATAAAGGVQPTTSPPFNAGDDLVKAAAADLVYLNLHGFDGQPHYYGQQGGIVGPTAVTADMVARHDWSGVVVFAEVCFSAKDGGGPIARAFLDGGARAFIGSTTVAYGRINPVIWDGEADRLVHIFRKYMQLRPNASPARLLLQAKNMLAKLSWPLDHDDHMTLNSFVCLEAKHERKTDI